MRSLKVIEMLFPGPRRPVMCALFQEPQRWWLLSELAGRAGVTPAGLRRHMAALRACGIGAREDGRPALLVPGRSTTVRSSANCSRSWPSSLRAPTAWRPSWWWKTSRPPRRSRGFCWRAGDTASSKRTARREALEAFDAAGQRHSAAAHGCHHAGYGRPATGGRVARRRPDLRIVFMSGYGAARFTRRGAFLPKPFNPASLSRIVRRELDRPGDVEWAGARKHEDGITLSCFQGRNWLVAVPRFQ